MDSNTLKNNQPGMTLIVKTITRLTVGLILIYGIYIMLQGHSTPGGGFAAGVIVALSFIHLMLAFGKEAVLKKLDQPCCILLVSIGGLVFLLMITLSFMARESVFSSFLSRNHFALFGAGFMSICDSAVALMVGAGLFAIFLALVLFVSTGQKQEEGAKREL